MYELVAQASGAGLNRIHQGNKKDKYNENSTTIIGSMFGNNYAPQIGTCQLPCILKQGHQHQHINIHINYY